MYRVARERIVVDSVPADFGCFVPDFPSCADCTVPRFARTTYLEKRERERERFWKNATQRVLCELLPDTPAACIGHCCCYFKLDYSSRPTAQTGPIARLN